MESTEVQDEEKPKSAETIREPLVQMSPKGSGRSVLGRTWEK